MYLHQKIIRIYADIIQNHTLPGVFPNFWRAVYIFDFKKAAFQNHWKIIPTPNIWTVVYIL